MLTACCPHVGEVTTRTLERSAVSEEGQSSLPVRPGREGLCPLSVGTEKPKLTRILVKPLSKDAMNSH